MDLNGITSQIIAAFAKEGFNFLFSIIKDKRAARKAEKDLAKKAKDAALKLLNDETVDWPSNLNWEKVATLFWLGNDLMWIEDMMYRGASPDRVLEGIIHAQQYVRDFGFPDNKSPAQQLSICNILISSLVGIKGTTEDEFRILRQHYKTVAQEIQTVKWIIHGMASVKEPGFEKLRAVLK